MPLDITFTLSDNDLEHFQGIVNKAKSSLQGELSAIQIEAAAKRLIEDATSTELPDFIAERLAKLQLIINMIGDEEWQLGDEDRNRVLGALVYFCDPEDLIPDHIPGIGFLDDAIYIELVLQELKSEVASYEDFCRFRAAEEDRRREQGLDPRVEREEWLADKRAALHERMGKRGRGLSAGSRWRLRW